MNNIKKGFEYEKYISKHLSELSDAVWLWKDVPELHLISAGLIHDKNYFFIFF